jgi:leucyl-tRNA synthetase
MPEKPYDHNQIELKWHARWQNATFYKAEENSLRPKYYVLEMLPFPSGTRHIDVPHPMGWDAFGLPAENAAIAKPTPAARVDAAEHRTYRGETAPVRDCRLSLSEPHPTGRDGVEWGWDES